MSTETPDRLHKACPTCTCQSKKPHTIVYPPNLLFYGACGSLDGCGKVRWQSETWTYHDGSWTPSRRTHCGCCPEGCFGHERIRR